MSWINILKQNIDVPIEPKTELVETDQNTNDINPCMTNDEYFYLSQGSEFIDKLSEFKKEFPPWLLSKASVYDIYEFYLKFIVFQDVELEYRLIKDEENENSDHDIHDV